MRAPPIYTKLGLGTKSGLQGGRLNPRLRDAFPSVTDDWDTDLSLEHGGAMLGFSTHCGVARGQRRREEENRCRVPESGQRSSLSTQ